MKMVASSFSIQHEFTQNFLQFMIRLLPFPDL